MSEISIPIQTLCLNSDNLLVYKLTVVELNEMKIKIKKKSKQRI